MLKLSQRIIWEQQNNNIQSQTKVLDRRLKLIAGFGIH
jgi:hypothetical protein